MLILENDGTVTYKGKVVATCTKGPTEETVQVNLSYQTQRGDAMIPLIYFAQGLAKIELRDSPALLETSTTAEDIEEWFNVPRLLSEKVIARNGYIWKFHKTDLDPWPSPLHGHDYDNGLKLDATNGDIFDVGTRHKCAKLKKKALNSVQCALRESKDFNALTVALCD